MTRTASQGVKRERSLTTDVDFDLAKIDVARTGRILHDEISARRHVADARQRDGLPVADRARPLTTHVVVPQRRSSSVRRHVRQFNDEVVRAMA